jgi:hypothetical protein
MTILNSAGGDLIDCLEVRITIWTDAGKKLARPAGN